MWPGCFEVLKHRSLMLSILLPPQVSIAVGLAVFGCFLLLILFIMFNKYGRRSKYGMKGEWWQWGGFSVQLWVVATLLCRAMCWGFGTWWRHHCPLLRFKGLFPCLESAASCWNMINWSVSDQQVVLMKQWRLLLPLYLVQCVNVSKLKENGISSSENMIIPSWLGCSLLPWNSSP